MSIDLWVAAGWLWLMALVGMAILGYGVKRHHFEAAGLFFGTGLVAFAWINRQPGCHSEHASDTRGRIGYLVPPAVACVAFFWSTTLGPLSDDFVLHQWASSGRWIPEEWPYLRPLPLALWQFVLDVGGTWNTLHAINVVLHATNSALVAGIGTTWAGRRAGVIAGTLFALYPGSVEAVAWTSGVFDLMATGFVLVSVWLWHARKQSPLVTAGMISACVGGLLSKETAVIIPALLLGSWVAQRCPRPLGKARLLGLVLTAALSIAFLVARFVTSPALAGHAQNLPASRYEWKEILVRPFASVSIPFRTDAGVAADVYVAALCVLVLAGTLLVHIVRSRREPGPATRPGSELLLFAVCWILLGALPLLRLFHVAPTLEGSRFVYLPAAGFCLLLSGAAGRGLGPPGVIAGVVLTVLVSIHALRLNQERVIWLDAAVLRDVVLSEARQQSGAVPCSSLQIEDAPDNLRGVYVFREGLGIALDTLPKNPHGRPCEFRWTGTSLEPR